MEQWRIVWRDGIVPAVSTGGLYSVYRALVIDDQRLIQGRLKIGGLRQYADLAVSQYDVFGWLFWQAGVLETIGECEQAVYQASIQIADLMGRKEAVLPFLEFWDNTKRELAVLQLLQEMRYSLHLIAQPDLEWERMYLDLAQKPTDWVLLGIMTDWLEENNYPIDSSAFRYLQQSRRAPVSYESDNTAAACCWSRATPSYQGQPTKINALPGPLFGHLGYQKYRRATVVKYPTWDIAMRGFVEAYRQHTNQLGVKEFFYFDEFTRYGHAVHSH